MKIDNIPRRRLDTGQVTALMNIQIISNPKSEVYPSPKALGASLVNKTSQLYARLSNFDTSYPINAFEFIVYYPKFVRPPTLLNVGMTWGAFEGVLDSYGFIFCVAIKKADKSGVPIPYQIWKGYDAYNIPQGSGSVEVMTIYDTYMLNVTGLEPLTDYIAYLIGGSVHPGYPDLMDASSTVQIVFRTEPAVICKNNLFASLYPNPYIFI